MDYIVRYTGVMTPEEAFELHNRKDKSDKSTPTTSLSPCKSSFSSSNRIDTNDSEQIKIGDRYV